MSMFTPENFRTELNAHLGSAFSLEPVLWQSAYSEYEFTPTLWPDFTAAELAAIIGCFGGRARRFGAAAPA
jgi:hypothetical protein